MLFLSTAAVASVAAAQVPYGAEKAKMNALMEGLNAELRMTGHTGITAQAMVIG
jgi:NAD(P)-dependent dehydrogenase (short-subunit alcohol dehydrogenase family)